MSNFTTSSDSRNLSTFLFNGQSNIRVGRGADGEPLFVASDLCKALGVANVSDVLSRLDEDEKDNIVLTDAIGRMTSVAAVNESGMYALILTSRKTEAKAFKRWITHEVLPAIREKGTYSSQALTPAQALLQAVTQIVEHERVLAEHEQRLLAVETRQTSIEQGSQYFTILAYASMQGLRIDNTTAQSYGIQAAKLSRAQNVPIGKSPDARYGHVGAYHVSILTQIFKTKE